VQKTGKTFIFSSVDSKQKKVSKKVDQIYNNKELYMLRASSFFDLSEFSAKEVFAGSKYAWDGLKNLKTHMNQAVYGPFSHRDLKDGVPLLSPLIYHEQRLQDADDCTITYGDATKDKLVVIRNGEELSGASVIMAGVVITGSRILLGKGVLIESGALIKEPVIIGDRTEVRQGAYLRGYCLVGKRCVVGHTTEVKHSIFLNDAKAGHFAYLGDSILGGDANLGAGTKFANLRFLPGNVQVKTENGTIDSGLRKFGAILGDRAQTGCNSVTNPGTMIGREGILMPNTTAPSGYHPAGTVIR
jgi:bifunctional N-acetylglucosamine-1-phosphate-uridyltransferase/glucosamine-1-phosphate-acetyltransferase GlmU-like protein